MARMSCTDDQSTTGASRVNEERHDVVRHNPRRTPWWTLDCRVTSTDDVRGRHRTLLSRPPACGIRRD
jgi:hypothetical protein